MASVMEIRPGVISSYSPWSDELLGEVRISSRADIERAVAQARVAGTAWQALSVKTRVTQIERAFDALKKSADDLASLMCDEMGKPIHDCHVELEDGFECLRWYLDNAEAALAARLETVDAHERHEVQPVARGVTAVIVAWNFPFLNAVWSVFPNLLCGNTVVFKHSEKTPLFAIALRDIIAPHVPAGVFTVITGDGHTGEQLASADVDQICFTGSTRVGLELQRRVSDRAASDGRFVAVHTELGGSAAGIVFADAHIDSTVEAIYRARFANAGQVCDGLKRLVVAASIATPLVTALERFIGERPLGDPRCTTTFMGPLVDRQQLRIVEEQVAEARASGARPTIIGELPRQGACCAPTLVHNVSPRMRVWREEVFGPVLPIITFDDLEQAVALANETRYGLGGYIFTADYERAHTVRRQLRTGMVAINGAYYVRPFVPFTSGGYGLSGTGSNNGLQVFHALCKTQVTSYPTSIAPQVAAAPVAVNNAKREHARATLDAHGVWKAHDARLVEIAPYRLPMRIGANGEIFELEVALWVFDEGTSNEDAYYVASYRGASDSVPLVRIQSLCPHGHYFHSVHCDCDEQRDLALRALVTDPAGGVLIMGVGDKHAGRGIGQVMIAGLYSYGFRTGRDVVTEAFNDLRFNRDERDFEPALEILRRKGIGKMRLLTNNPDKVRHIGQGRGLEVVEIVKLIGGVTTQSLKERILLTRAGHYYDRDELQRAVDAVVESEGVHPISRW